MSVYLGGGGVGCGIGRGIGRGRGRKKLRRCPAQAGVEGLRAVKHVPQKKKSENFERNSTVKLKNFRWRFKKNYVKYWPAKTSAEIHTPKGPNSTLNAKSRRPPPDAPGWEATDVDLL